MAQKKGLKINTPQVKLPHNNINININFNVKQNQTLSGKKIDNNINIAKNLSEDINRINQKKSKLKYKNMEIEQVEPLAPTKISNSQCAKIQRIDNTKKETSKTKKKFKDCISATFSNQNIKSNIISNELKSGYSKLELNKKIQSKQKQRKKSITNQQKNKSHHQLSQEKIESLYTHKMNFSMQNLKRYKATSYANSISPPKSTTYSKSTSKYTTTAQKKHIEYIVNQSDKKSKKKNKLSLGQIQTQSGKKRKKRIINSNSQFFKKRNSVVQNNDDYNNQLKSIMNHTNALDRSIKKINKKSKNKSKSKSKSRQKQQKLASQNQIYSHSKSKSQKIDQPLQMNQINQFQVQNQSIGIEVEIKSGQPTKQAISKQAHNQFIILQKYFRAILQIKNYEKKIADKAEKQQEILDLNQQKNINNSQISASLQESNHIQEFDEEKNNSQIKRLEETIKMIKKSEKNEKNLKIIEQLKIIKKCMLKKYKQKQQIFKQNSQLKQNIKQLIKIEQNKKKSIQISQTPTPKKLEQVQSAKKLAKQQIFQEQLTQKHNEQKIQNKKVISLSPQKKKQIEQLKNFKLSSDIFMKLKKQQKNLLEQKKQEKISNVVIKYKQPSIVDLLKQKQLIINEKHIRSKQVMYSMFQNKLVSPKTFNSKLNELDRILQKQRKTIERSIKEAEKINDLIKDIDKDKLQLADYENSIIKHQNLINIVDEPSLNKSQEQISESSIKQIKLFGLSEAPQTKFNQLFQDEDSDQSMQYKKITKKSTISIFQQTSINQNDKLPVLDHYQQQVINNNKVITFVGQSDYILSNRSGQLFQEIQQQNPLESSKLSFETSLNFIKQYCISLCEFIRANRDYKQQFKNNIKNPLYYDPKANLKSYRFTQSNQYVNNYNSRNNNFIYPYFKISYPPQKIISDSIIQQFNQKLNKLKRNQPSTHILTIQLQSYHLKCIIDTFNQSLNYERSHSLYGKPFPWQFNSKFLKNLNSKFNHISQNTQIEEQDKQYDSVLGAAIARIIQWGSTLCGFIPQAFQIEKEQGLQIDESYIVQIRETRMALMLQKTLIEDEQKMTYFEDFKTEIKLQMTEKILEYLLNELKQQLREINVIKKVN